MVLAETSAALSGLKAAYDIAKGIQALNTSTEVRQATSEMLDALITARTQAFEAVETEASRLKQIRDLEAEIVRLKAWDGEKQRYQLKRFYPGTYAYELKLEMAAGEPTHRLCASCYGRGEKAILQAMAKSEQGRRIHQCPSCRTEITIGQEMMDGASETPAEPTPPKVIMNRPRPDGM